MPNLRLTSDVEIPQVGLGVYKMSDDEVRQAVPAAFEAGYRLIDTATLYGNEEAVGRAIADSDLPRDEIFVTTKLWNSDQGYDNALRAFEASRRRLGLDYVDLYLIHWPQPARDLYVETWRAFEKLQADGLVRAIGVSNFQPPHLQRLIDESSTPPALNQIELHPWLAQSSVRAFHSEHGIVTQAWGPIGHGRGLLEDRTIVDIAQEHDRDPAQIVLRWHLQLGNGVIPKSARPERIRSNVELFDFELSDEDMARLNELDSGDRKGPHPDRFNS